MIQNAIQAANQAYINSNANVTVNMVGLQQVSMTRSGSGMYATMSTLERTRKFRTCAKSLPPIWSCWSRRTPITADTRSHELLGQGVVHVDGRVFDRLLELPEQPDGGPRSRPSAGSRSQSGEYGQQWLYPYSYGYRVCATGRFPGHHVVCTAPRSACRSSAYSLTRP